MNKYAFEKVVCPKCGKAYAVPQGSTKSFHCPGKNCHEMVKPAAAVKITDAKAKD